MVDAVKRVARARTVGEYIARAPKAVQGKLRQIRAAIKAAVPAAKESFSYRMPYYHYKGRLIYFQACAHHIGLYVPRIVSQFERELRDYKTTKATIRIPLDGELPLNLIRKMVRARAKMNEGEDR